MKTVKKALLVALAAVVLMAVLGYLDYTAPVVLGESESATTRVIDTWSYGGNSSDPQNLFRRVSIVYANPDEFPNESFEYKMEGHFQSDIIPVNNDGIGEDRLVWEVHSLYKQYPLGLRRKWGARDIYKVYGCYRGLKPFNFPGGECYTFPQ